MGIRVEHTVTKLPDTYVTRETVFKYVPAEHDPKVKVRIEEEIEHRGGYLIKFMRGHSIRCFTEHDLHRLGFTVKPRLVDETSGQIVNEHGIPVDIEHLVSGGIQDSKGDEGGIDNFSDGVATDDPIEQIIKETA